MNADNMFKRLGIFSWNASFILSLYLKMMHCPIRKQKTTYAVVDMAMQCCVFFLTKGSVLDRINQCMAKPIIPRLPKKEFWDYISFEQQCYVMRMMICVLSRFLIGK